MSSGCFGERWGVGTKPSGKYGAGYWPPLEIYVKGRRWDSSPDCFREI